MRLSLLAFISALAVAVFPLEAAQVNECWVWSKAMEKNVPVVVVLPDGHGKDKDRRYSVAYLLHGAGGDHREYLTRTGKISSAVDRHGFIAVCPDGNKLSWWMDSPVDATCRYETFVACELVTWADRSLRTMPRRTRRALVGASMGGYGALSIACAHKDVFGAVYSIHGAVELRPFSDVERWMLAKLLDPTGAKGPIWDRYSVIERAKGVANGELQIVMVIGSDDQYFLQGNRKLHELFSRNKVAHTYIEIRARTQEESAHTWAFQAIGEDEVYPRISKFFSSEE